MYVVKRDGKHESVRIPQAKYSSCKVQFDKISDRLKILTNKEPPLSSIDHILVTQKVISGVYAGVTTRELDNLAAETAAYMSTQHPGTLRLS
jgi:hypothetical protein